MQTELQGGGSGTGPTPAGSHEVVIPLIPAGAIHDDPELQQYRAAQRFQAELSGQVGDYLDRAAADLADQRRAAARAQAIAVPEDPAMAAAGMIGPGLAQGAANTLNGVQDSLIGMGNLLVRGVNAMAGYTVTPERASPDWSRNFAAYETDAEHNVSKAAGGFGVSVLAGGGLGGAGRSRLRCDSSEGQVPSGFQ